MSRFRFQYHNDIPGLCIQRIPLCNLLSCTSSVKLSSVSHRKSALLLSCLTRKQREKRVFTAGQLPRALPCHKAQQGQGSLCMHQAPCLGENEAGEDEGCSPRISPPSVPINPTASNSLAVDGEYWHSHLQQAHCRNSNFTYICIFATRY